MSVTAPHDQVESQDQATLSRVGRPNLKLAVIFGGTIEQDRRAAEERGNKPHLDELRMEERLSARLYDFAWLHERARKERLTKMLLRVAQRLGRWSVWLAVRVWWQTRNEDVVYATGEDVALPLATILRLARGNRPALIMRTEQWSKGRTASRRFLYNSYFTFALKRIDLILCRTSAHLQLLKETYAVPAEKLMLVPETIDSTFFNRSTPPASEAAVEIPARPYIVSAGLEMRDYETLIEAVRDLPVQVVIGAGSPWSKFSFSSEQVPDLPENVHVASYNPVQMRELYRSAEMVVVPVRPTLRSCGITVVLEAWAMQCPLIATRTVGLSSYIEDNETALQVEPLNAADLRAKILYLLDHRDEAARLAENGHRRVIEEFNGEQYVRNVGLAVDKVMRRAGG